MHMERLGLYTLAVTVGGEGEEAEGTKETKGTEELALPPSPARTFRAVRLPNTSPSKGARPRPARGGLWTTCLWFVPSIERANVSTHAVAFAAFAAYLVARVVLASNAATPHGIDPFTLVQIAAIGVMTAVFGMSAIFHSSTQNVVASAYLLVLDRSFVYASIVLGSAADLVIATMGSATPLTGCALSKPLFPDPSVPWQTYADPLIAGSIAIMTVVVVRATRWPEDTSGQKGFQHASGLDSRRPGHISGPFSATYAVMVGACALIWVCSADYELRMLPQGVGPVVVSVKAVGTTIVMLVGANDAQETTDAYAMNLPLALRKHLPRSHTIWHVSTFLVAVTIVGVREVALAAQRDASMACADGLPDGDR